jgi:hypothetical protein
VAPTQRLTVITARPRPRPATHRGPREEDTRSSRAVRIPGMLANPGSTLAPLRDAERAPAGVAGLFAAGGVQPQRRCASLSRAR